MKPKEKYSKKLLLFARFSILGMFLCVFFYYGRNLSFSVQWPLYEALRTTSAIIFGVMGAWIALIYPQALSELKGQTPSDMSQSSQAEFRKLLNPLIYSTITLLFVLILGIFVPVVKQIPFLMQFYRLFRGLSYACLFFLTIGQSWSIILTLLPADIVMRVLNLEAGKRQAVNKYLSKTETKKRDYS